MPIPVKLDPAQFNQIKQGQKDIKDSIDALAEIINNGFTGLVGAIQQLDQPDSDSAPVKGELVARYRVPADLPDFEFELIGRNFTDSEGHPTHAKDVDLQLDIANEEAISATLGEQTLSDDGNEVRALVRAHVESPSADMGVLMYKAVNRNDGSLIAADSDEFIVSAGAAKVGTLQSDIPGLTPEPEEPTGGGETGGGSV